MTCAGQARAFAAVMTLCVFAVGAAGCPGTFIGDDDDDQSGADAGPTPDGGPAEAGIVIDFRIGTPLPASLPGQVTVERIELELRDLRVIGDAAPGDERTTRAEVKLTWRDDASPEPVVFDAAPPGLYSGLEFDIGGSGVEHPMRIRGTVQLGGGDPDAFEIDLENMVAVQIPLSIELAAGEVVTVPVQLDYAALLAGIDWSQVEKNDDGVRELEDGPQMNAILQQLPGAFSVGAPE